MGVWRVRMGTGRRRVMMEGWRRTMTMRRRRVARRRRRRRRAVRASYTVTSLQALQAVV